MPLSIPFQRGQLVVVVLTAPRQKIWGRILGLETAGIVVRGIDIAPWEDVLTLVNRGHADQVALDTRFFPMHRVEQMYLDEVSSGVPSLGEVFKERAGLDPMEFLADPELPRRKRQ